MKYINKINWTKVDEMRSKFFFTENEILAVTSTNIGSLKEPKIEAHIITADNKIKHLGIIDAQRLVNAANKADKQIALIFNLTKGVNEWYSNDELIEQIGSAWIMRGDKVRTILGCCFKNYKVTKIENLV